MNFHTKRREECTCGVVSVGHTLQDQICDDLAKEYKYNQPGLIQNTSKILLTYEWRIMMEALACVESIALNLYF